MKMQLDYPFSEEFKAGYLGINSEPRRVLSLIRYDGSRTSVSYARYLMSVKLGRFLNPEEHVDHINNNPMDDYIENLQILSHAENNRKGRKRTMIQLICPICNSQFEREARQVNHKIAAGKNLTCSRKCGGIISHRTK